MGWGVGALHRGVGAGVGGGWWWGRGAAAAAVAVVVADGVGVCVGAWAVFGGCVAEMWGRTAARPLSRPQFFVVICRLAALHVHSWPALWRAAVHVVVEHLALCVLEEEAVRVEGRWVFTGELVLQLHVDNVQVIEHTRQAGPCDRGCIAARAVTAIVDDDGAVAAVAELVAEEGREDRNCVPGSFGLDARVTGIKWGMETPDRCAVLVLGVRSWFASDIEGQRMCRSGP